MHCRFDEVSRSGQLPEESGMKHGFIQGVSPGRPLCLFRSALPGSGFPAPFAAPRAYGARASLLYWSFSSGHVL